MSKSEKKYQGAQRFKAVASITGDIGPGSYDLKANAMTNLMMRKPTSNKGVSIVTSERFATLPNKMPGPGKYENHSFIELLKEHHSSRKGTLSNVSKEKYAEMELTKNSCYYSPGPGIYNLNYAIGRHVANDFSFSLKKSDLLKKRDRVNSEQLANLKELIGKDDIFTDKKACRRMAYLSLYYPLNP